MEKFLNFGSCAQVDRCKQESRITSSKFTLQKTQLAVFKNGSYYILHKLPLVSDSSLLQFLLGHSP